MKSIEKMIMNNKQPVIINIKHLLDLNNFNLILKEEIDYYIERLKILKVVDLETSKKEIEQIVNYFSEQEKKLSINTLTDDNLDINIDTSIKTRLKYFKNQAFRKSKSIVQKLSVIANHHKVSQLNSAQQANLLRSVINSSNIVNLAKRALNKD